MLHGSIDSLGRGNTFGFSKGNSFGNSSQWLNPCLICVELHLICWCCWSVVGSIYSCLVGFAESANDSKVVWFGNECISTSYSDSTLVVWFDGLEGYSTSVTLLSNPI